jgi:hypothetical protein
VSCNHDDGIYTWHLPTTSPSVCRHLSVLPSADSSLWLRSTSADILSRRKQRIGGNAAGDGKTAIRDGASIGHPEILAPTCCGCRSLYNSQTTRASQRLRHYRQVDPKRCVQSGNHSNSLVTLPPLPHGLLSPTFYFPF